MSKWVSAVVQTFKEHDIRFCCYVPDNRLAPILEAMQEDGAFQVVSVSREEEGVGVVAGAALAGLGSVMMMQTTGFGTVINALGSLAIPQRLGFLMVISERGHLGENVMTHLSLGQGMRRILDAVGVPHYTLDGGKSDPATLAGAVQLARTMAQPVALILHQQL